MDFWLLFSKLCCRGGQIIVGGGLVWFTLLFLWADRTRRNPEAAVLDEGFRVTSVGMSVGLTILILGEILSFYLDHGGFHLTISGLRDVFLLAKYLTILLFWVHWGYLEIVVMHRFRLDTPTLDTPPLPQYLESRIRLRRTLLAQLSLFAFLLLMELLAQSLVT